MPCHHHGSILNLTEMTSSIIYCLLNISLLTHSTNISLVSKASTEREVTKTRLIVFSGSDWCKNCILFKRNVLDTPEFKTFAKENLELVTADFPQKNQLSKEQIAKNEALAEKYNPKGEFPKLVLISGDGSEYKEIPYTNQSPQEFIAAMKNLIGGK